MDRLLRLKDVMEILQLSKTTIYKLVKENKFPHQVKISDRQVAWRQSDIQKYIENLRYHG